MFKILIIDDEFANAELVKVYLEMNGHQTHVALTGVEGFNLVQQMDFDLIFLDLLMPDFTWNGFKTAAQLRSYNETSHIPIVALTAAGKTAQALEAGCNDILHRPFKLEQLNSVLEKYLGAAC